MNALASVSAEITRAMDFAGGTVVHINVSFFAMAGLVGIIVAAVWIVKSKR